MSRRAHLSMPLVKSSSKYTVDDAPERPIREATAAAMVAEEWKGCGAVRGERVTVRWRARVGGGVCGGAM